MEPHRTPRRLPSPRLEGAVDQPAVGAFVAPMRASEVVAEPLDDFLSVASAPTTERALGDPEESTYLEGANTLPHRSFDGL